MWVCPSHGCSGLLAKSSGEAGLSGCSSALTVLRKKRWGAAVAALCHLRHSIHSRIRVYVQPKLCTELQASIKCLTQLLALEAMALTNTGTDGASEFHEAAALLQQRLIYNGQVLDAALEPRWPTRVQGWHIVAHVPSLCTHRVRSDADAGKVPNQRVMARMCATSLK